VNGVELATAYVSLAVDGSQVDSGVRRSLSGVGTQADRVGRDSGKRMGAGISGGVLASVAKVAGPLAAIFAGIGVGKILSDSITEGSDLQQAIGGADAVFKKDAASIKATAEAAADSIGLPKSAYLELATVLGAGLKNKGITDFADETEKLITIGGDLAAQFGGPTTDAVDAIASAMRGESDPIEKYGISLNETAVNAKLLEMGLKKVDGRFTEQQKTAGRLALITQQAADAQGAFARESDTYAGSQARLSATWANLKAQIGTALLPTLTRVSNWFLKTGLPAAKSFAEGIGGVASVLFKGDFAGAAKTFGFAEDSRQVDFLFRMRDGLVRIRDTAKGLFDLFIKGDFTGALRKGLGVEEDSAVVGFLFKIRDGAIEAWDRLKQFGSFLKNDLFPALKQAYEVIAPAVREAFKGVADAFGPGDGAGIRWRELGEILTQKVIPFIAQMIKVYLPVWEQQIKTVITAVKFAWQAFETWRDIVARVASALLGHFIRIVEGFQGVLEALGKVPGFGWAKTAAENMQETIDKAKGIKEAIDRIPGTKKISITAQVSMPGRITLPGGDRVNIGLREHGGPVRKGQPYIVGERRPELFVPNESGRIIPRVPEPAMAGAGVGGGGIDYWRMAEAMTDTMRQATFAVDTRDNARAVARHQNRRQGQ
jgi:hypothetical protein